MFDGADETRTEHGRVKRRARPGRRRWSAEEKARIVAEVTAPGVVVSAVARRWRVRPQQLFAWRREAACAGLALPSGAAVTGPSVPAFVPILTEAVTAQPAPATASAPALEIELAGAVVRVAAGADTAQLTAVLRAVRASAMSA